MGMCICTWRIEILSGQSHRPTYLYVMSPLQSNMMKAEERFPHLCGFTNLTRLECLAEPGGYSRQPCLKTLPTSIGLLTQLRTLRVCHRWSPGLL